MERVGSIIKNIFEPMLSDYVLLKIVDHITKIISCGGLSSNICFGIQDLLGKIWLRRRICLSIKLVFMYMNETAKNQDCVLF